MRDITVICPTSNRENPVFESRICDRIKHSAGDLPIICVSQKPMNFGNNICVGNIGASPDNYVRQMMVGAVMATTRFIAMTELDSLYPPEYFQFTPPCEDIVYIPDNFWVAWTEHNTFRPKRRYDVTGIIGRKPAIGILRELALIPNSYDVPKIVPMLTKIDSYHIENPVVFLITRNGMHYKTGRTNPVVESLPYWGTMKEIRKVYLS